MQPANPSGGQVVVSVQGIPMDTDTRFGNVKQKFARQLIILGSAHIVIGIICIIFQCVRVGLWPSSLGLNGDGLSTGVLFIVTGTIGIRGGKNKGKCQVVTFNVLSILSAIYAAYMLILAVPSVIDLTAVENSNMGYRAEGYLEMNILLGILAFIEDIVAICSSVVCCYIGACFDDCGPSCCCPTEPQYQQLVNIDQSPIAQQYIVGNQQQAVFNLIQQQAVLNPNQQQAVFNLNQQQAVLNPNRQQLMFFPHQPVAGFNYQQHATQCFPHQPNVMLIPYQPASQALSPEATGQGPQIGQCTRLANAPLPTEGKAQLGGKESLEAAKFIDDPEQFARVCDDESEYHY